MTFIAVFTVGSIAAFRADNVAADAPVNPCTLPDFFDVRCDIYDELDSGQKEELAATANLEAGIPAGPEPLDEDSGGTPPVLEPDDPPEPPTPGIEEGLSAPPIASSVFVATNQWTGMIGDKLATVWAGNSGADPRIGMLFLQIENPDGEQRSLAITAPTFSGPLTIQSLTNGVLQLAGTLTSTLKFALSGTKITL